METIMKIGDEVIIIGHSIYYNGFSINSIGYIINIEEKVDGVIYKISISLKEKGNWFTYKKENIKLSNSQIRDNKLNQLLNKC